MGEAGGLAVAYLNIKKRLAKRLTVRGGGGEREKGEEGEEI